MNRGDLLELIGRAIRERVQHLGHPISLEMASAILTAFKAARLRIYQRRIGEPPCGQSPLR
jgi:hypothetical protein